MRGSFVGTPDRSRYDVCGPAQTTCRQVGCGTGRTAITPHTRVHTDTSRQTDGPQRISCATANARAPLHWPIAALAAAVARVGVAGVVYRWNPPSDRVCRDGIGADPRAPKRYPATDSRGLHRSKPHALLQISPEAQTTERGRPPRYPVDRIACATPYTPAIRFWTSNLVVVLATDDGDGGRARR